MSKKDNSTSTDLGNQNYSATDAETEAFDINPYMIELMWSEPFYAKVLRGVTKKRTEKVPTAGVSIYEGDVSFWYNPRFCASLIKDEGVEKIKGLALHECMHLVYNHCSERKLEPFLIWNYATDCAINSIIPTELLPECGIIPGKAFKELSEEDKAKMDEERIERYDRMSAFVAALPTGLSSEEYFALFMQNEDFQKSAEEQEGGMYEIIPSMDDHDGWGNEVSDQDREIIRGKVKQVISEAVKECDQKGNWGSVPAKTRAEIRQMISTEVPWQTVLKKFIGFTRRSNRATSRMRLNKKYPGVHSGFKRGYTSSIAVYIDQSGSVSDKELELLFGELNNLTNHTGFVTYHFDTEIDEESRTEWRKGNSTPAHRTRFGGTDFKPVTKHANERKKDFDGYLILTDGFAPDPGPSKLRRGWLITPNGEVQDWMNRGNDFVIHMKWPKGAAAA